MTLRLLCLFLIWVALLFILSPFDLIYDCMPCLPEFVQEKLYKVTMCVACLPACGCTLGVIGVVWVVMRPWVGITGMTIFCCCVAGFAGFEAHNRRLEAEEKRIEEARHSSGERAIRLHSVYGNSAGEKINLDK